MKFIQIDAENNVLYVNFMPFDEKYGMGKSAEELEREGILTQAEIPNPELIEGKNSLLKYNPTNDEFYYEYVDRPLTPEEEIKKRLELIEKALDDLLLGGM